MLRRWLDCCCNQCGCGSDRIAARHRKSGARGATSYSPRRPCTVQGEPMNKRSAPEVRRVGHAGPGAGNASAWIEEGNGLAATARTIRARWLWQRRQIKARPTGFPLRRELVGLHGNPRASVLLMGYAVEMYLKAGLAKWLKLCDEPLLDADARRYSHDYITLANDLEIEECVAPRDLLQFLHDAVTLEARYPARSRGTESVIEAINRRTGDMWSDSRFTEICRMVRKLRSHVAQMNRDNAHATCEKRVELEAGGYWVMRVGGLLPSRVTVRPPNGQKWGYAEINDVLEHDRSIWVQRYRSVCKLYLVDRKGTSGLVPEFGS